MAECKEVIHQLKRRQHTTWSVELKSLSPQTLLTVLTDINKCKAGGLCIVSTHFDINCVIQLGLIKLTIGYFTLWNECTRDKV